MTVWDHVLVGFDAEDETANFGTRAIAEGDNTIYQTITLATIQAGEKTALEDKPLCQSLFHPKTGLAVTADRSFTFFNVTCKEVLMNATFDTNIEVIELSSDGAFIFFGLVDGQLACLHLPSKGTLIFSVNLSGNYMKNNSFFAKILPVCTDDFLVYVVDKVGKMYSISGIEMGALNEALVVDPKEIENCTKNMEVKVVHPPISHLHPVTSSSFFLDPLSQIPSTFLSSTSLKIWSPGSGSTDVSPLLEENMLKKIQVCSSFIISLTAKGVLLFICPYTLQQCFMWQDDYIQDFTILENVIHGDVYTSLLLLTEQEIILLELRGMKVKFRLKVSPTSYLVENQSGAEEILFLEGFGETKTDTVRVKVITEIYPEYRLERILQRGRFAEAEKFAKTFDLSLEIVHKAKAKWLMDELSPWKYKPGQHCEADLLELLELIKDVEFVAECCINTFTPNVKMTKKLLDYALRRLKNDSSKGSRVPAFINQVGNLTLRLGTILQIEGSDTTPEQWQFFSVGDLLGICLKYLSQGEIRKAVIVCGRHKSAMQGKLTEEVGFSLLDKIPESVPGNDIIAWLRCFIPLFLSKQPQAFSRFISWIKDKTKCLELSETEKWPKIGLHFASQVLDILNSLLRLAICNQESLSLYQGSQQLESPLHQLNSLILTLQQLCDLKQNHAITVSLDAFTQEVQCAESKMEVVWLLFDDVPLEGIPALIKNFIKNYCKQYFMDVDIVIKKYIKKIIATSSGWWDCEGTVWESRVLAFIDCIKSQEDIMESTVTLVKDAMVPWNSEIQKLAEKAIQLNHPLSADVCAHKNNVTKKLVLKKYGLPLNTDLTNVISLIRYIYNQGYEEMVEDAKLVCSQSTKYFLEIYIYYFYHCIENETVEKAFRLIDSDLSTEQIKEVYESILWSIANRLQHRFSRFLTQYVEALPALMGRLWKIAPESVKEMETLKTVHMLKNEFEQNVTFNDICHPEEKHRILKTCLRKILEDVWCGKEKLEVGEVANAVTPRALELALKLQIPLEESLLELAIQSAAAFKIKLTAEFVRSLIDSGGIDKCERPKLFNLVSQMILSYFPNEDTQGTVYNSIYSLICNILVTSTAGEVTKYNDLAIILNLLQPPQTSSNHTVWTSLYTDPVGASMTHIPRQTVISLLEYHLSLPTNQDNETTGYYHETLDGLLPGLVRDLPYDLTSLQILHTIHWFLSTHHIQKLEDMKRNAAELKKEVTPFICKLFVKIVSHRTLDLILALNLLSFFQPDKALKFISNVLTLGADKRRRCAVSLIGKYYCYLHEINSHEALLLSTKYTLDLWARRIQHFGISSKELGSDVEKDQKILLMKLMAAPGVGLSLLKHYCMDMGFDQQDCLLLYLQHTLLCWTPVFQVKTDYKTGRPDLIVETKVEALSMQCRKIVSQIRDHEALCDHLREIIWNKVNYYYYEVFYVIVEILESHSRRSNDTFYNTSENRLLLGFLSTYVRISEPQQEEKDAWFHMFPNTQSLPEIASYRLPFAKLPQTPWKLIRPELSLKTYKLWLQIPVWFGVVSDKDLICTLTINNLKKTIPTVRDGWELHFKNKKLMDEIMECISHISNLQYATASLYFVVNNVIPPGIDQVDAAQKCCLQTRKWVALEENEESLYSLEKAEKKYITVSTMHILHKYGLARPEYLALVLQPDELISALYHDPSIVEQSTSSNLPFPDINEAVESIFHLHRDGSRTVNLVKVRLQLLNDWLQHDNLSGSHDDTYSFSNASHYSSNSENILRACYMLSSEPVNQAGSYLMGLAFSRVQEETNSPPVRLKALQCLMAITSPQQLELITARSVDTIRTCMQSLEFVCELDRLGLVYTVSGFESYPKEELVKCLVSKCSPVALQLASRISRSFSLWIPHLWDQILEQMSTLAMLSDLETLLPELTEIAFNINPVILSDAWNKVLLSNLAKAEPVRNDNLDPKMERSLELLQICPSIEGLDLSSISQHCQRLKCAELSKQLQSLIKNADLQNGF